MLFAVVLVASQVFASAASGDTASDLAAARQKVADTQAEANAAADESSRAQAHYEELEQKIDIARIEGQVKASSIRRVSEFVEKHPEESVSIIRTWLHETT